ncbi:hypothetical protein N333_00554, partial [Nestor notabilis]
VGTYSVTHGVAFCTPCKDGMTTRTPGTSSMKDCVKKGRTEHAISIVHKVPALLLIVLPALLILNVLFILTSCYWFYQDYRLPSPRASKMKGNTLRMEKRIPKQGPQALPDAGPASDTSTSQRGDKEQTDGASSPAMTLNLADETDETTPVLAPEKRRRDSFLSEIPSTHS